VGYGSLFTADKPMRIAVVACGYADGYPRSAALGTPVTVAGVPSRIVGRVSMDMLTVDVTHIPHANVGSRVVLWGEGGPSIDTVAEHAGRIGYELMCGLTKRVPVTVV
jgi:alanine racemase